MKKALFLIAAASAFCLASPTRCLPIPMKSWIPRKRPTAANCAWRALYHFELVVAKDSKEAKDNPVVVYVTDHAGTKVPTGGAKRHGDHPRRQAKVSVNLVPDGDNRLKGWQVRLDAGHEGRGVDHFAGQGGRAGALYSALWRVESHRVNP
jgi:hypothetical protein